jgi:hypothetical protein
MFTTTLIGPKGERNVSPLKRVRLNLTFFCSVSALFIFSAQIHAQVIPTSGGTCDGTYTGTFYGSVTVSAGQVCDFTSGGIGGNVFVNGGTLLLSNAIVNGNVQVSGGSLVLTNVTVRQNYHHDDDSGQDRHDNDRFDRDRQRGDAFGGNVQIDGSATFSIGPSTFIAGDLEIENIPDGSALNQICGTTVSGNLRFRNNRTAVEIGTASMCAGNMIGGDLKVQNNSALTTLSNNTIGGDAQDQNNTATTLVIGNTIGGDLQVRNNSASVTVAFNVVQKDLECQNDPLILGGSNTANRNEGCPTILKIPPEPLPQGVSGPLIESAPPTAAVVGKPMEYQVVASSAAPASLVYSLSTAPAGMTISVTEGLVQWTPAANEAGDQQVTIVAHDSGGQTSQSFTLSVFGIGPETSVLISAANGGTITVNDPSSMINGLSISIPAGALASDTTIKVSELIPPPTIGGTPHFFMEAFSIDPDGTSLAIPAKITVPYDVSKFSTNQGIPAESFLGAYFVETSTGDLQFLNSFSVDTVHHEVTGTVPHFSGYMISNTAQLCPPPISQQVPCPSTYPPNASSLTPSLLPPALMVHGFQAPTPWCGQMGNESTWGQLRYLLSQQLDSGLGGRIDSWEFNWDSACVPFETSAFYLEEAIRMLRSLEPSQQGQQPSPVNIVAHSFGGILVRAYLAAGQPHNPIVNLNPLISYNHDVNSLISLATPYQGIGGTVVPPLSTFYANRCASLGQLFPRIFVTCYEAGTGNPGNGEGGFLKALNVTQLTTLQSQNATLPQYDIVMGQRVSSCISGGSCSLQTDDGLITTAGGQLCSVPGCIQEINPGILSAITGFCHSGALLDLTCDPNNFPIAEVDSIIHPVWDKVCTFLGCLPAINVTVSPQAGGTVTSSPQGTVTINCGQNCTGLYPAGTAVTLTATPSSGYTFTGWSGACSGSSTQCILPVTSVDLNLAGYQVRATFALASSGATTYTYTGLPFDQGYINCIPTYECPIGTSITVTITSLGSCTISDGVNSGSCQYPIANPLTFNAAGDIVAWAIELNEVVTVSAVPPYSSYTVMLRTTHGYFGDIDFSNTYGVGVCQCSGSSQRWTHTPGNWVVSH